MSSDVCMAHTPSKYKIEQRRMYCMAIYFEFLTTFRKTNWAWLKYNTTLHITRYNYRQRLPPKTI